MNNQTDAQILEAHAAGTRGYRLPDGTCTRSAERCIASWRAGVVVASTRGRPPGSKNKPKTTRETLVDEPQAPQASVVLPEVVQASSDDTGATLEQRVRYLEFVIETFELALTEANRFLATNLSPRRRA
jgi:hypothetical protein